MRMSSYLQSSFKVVLPHGRSVVCICRYSLAQNYFFAYGNNPQLRNICFNFDYLRLVLLRQCSESSDIDHSSASTGISRQDFLAAL